MGCQKDEYDYNLCTDCFKVSEASGALLQSAPDRMYAWTRLRAGKSAHDEYETAQSVWRAAFSEESVLCDRASERPELFLWRNVRAHIKPFASFTEWHLVAKICSLDAVRQSVREMPNVLRAWRTV